MGDEVNFVSVFDKIIDFPVIEVNLGALVYNLGSINLPGSKNIGVVFNPQLLSLIQVLNDDLLFPEVGQGSVKIKQVLVLNYKVLLAA